MDTEAALEFIIRGRDRLIMDIEDITTAAIGTPPLIIVITLHRPRIIVIIVIIMTTGSRQWRYWGPPL